MKKLNKLFILLFAMGTMTALSACDHRKPNVELIQDMMEQENVRPQKYDDFFADGAGGARVPPENTQPVGFTPYKYKTDVIGASKNLKNPFASNQSQEVLAVGQKFYETNCMVCHGMHLKGDGPVASRLPLKPPPLNTDKIKGWPDGHIYHVITMGQGVMGPYASQIPQASRWQVVSYIRYLQKHDK